MKKFFEGLKGLFTPWYVFWVAGGTFCVIKALEGAGGNLSPEHASYGYWIGFAALLVAHIYRSLYHASKNTWNEAVQMLNESFKKDKDDENT